MEARQIDYSGKEYLERHNITAYLEVGSHIWSLPRVGTERTIMLKDAICRLLDDRPEKPAKFLSE